MNSNEIPLIIVPYPPELTIEEIVSRRTGDKLRSRGPNRFFIYRLAYLKELRKKFGDNISMSKISPYISLSWSKEPPEVKVTYKGLSDQVENRLVEMRRKGTPIIIHEKVSSPQPSPTENDLADDSALYDICFNYFYNYYYDIYYDYYSSFF
jgi:hypothetical protein